MRILTLTNTAGKEGGGVGEVVRNLVYFQNKLGCTSDLWFPSNEDLQAEVANISAINSNNLFPFDTIEKFGIGFPFSIFFKRRHVEQNYDLVHQHGIFLFNSVFTKSLKNIKKVISPHGYIESERLSISKRKKDIAFLLYERGNLKNCDCLVACSKQEAIGFREFGLKQPIGILPNGINDQVFRNDLVINDFKLVNNIPNTKKVLLFLSRIHPIKGIELLIDSIISLRKTFEINNWMLIVAGINENKYQEVLEDKVQLNRLSSIVKFIGPQYDEQKLKAFAAADCFILPSINENFGIVVIEALASGIPVIATKRTPWEDLVIKKCGWWVERSKDGLSSVLKELMLKKTDGLKQMGENGKKLVQEKYLWHPIAKQSLSLYQWVLNDFDDSFKNGFTLFEG